jgi:transketolase
VACGTALAKKMNNDKHLVYSLHGDGELQEGQNWEAIMFAAHHKIDNLIATIDYNGQQIDGPTDMVMNINPLRAKFEAFGWKVLEMDGNDMESVLNGLAQAKAATGQGKPVCILMTTVMGKGISFMEDTHEWHGIAPNDKQLEDALSQLGKTTYGDY